MTGELQKGFASCGPNTSTGAALQKSCSAAVAQAGGDAVDGHMDAVEGLVVVLAGAAAAQEVQLQKVQRVDIGQPQPDGFRELGIVLQQHLLSGEHKHAVMGERP